MTVVSVFSHDPTQALPISKFRAKLTSKQDVTSSVDAHCPSQNRMCGFAADTNSNPNRYIHTLSTAGAQ